MTRGPWHPDHQHHFRLHGTRLYYETYFYYETYGAGAPLLLIHGNGESIGSFKGQIGDSASHHRVIAMDSRGQGKSDLGTATLTYEQMAEDTGCHAHGSGARSCTLQ